MIFERYCVGLIAIMYSLIIKIQPKKLVAAQIVSKEVYKHTQINLQIYRHGHSSLESSFLKYDKYQDYSWPTPLNELTQKGFLQQRRLGQRILHRYSQNHQLINKSYHKNDILIRSTIIKRALDSARANLLGIFPNHRSSIIFEDNLSSYNSSLIPIFTKLSKKDSLLDSRYECPKYKKLFSDRLNTPEFLKFNKSLEPLYLYLTKHANEPIRDILKLKRYYMNVYNEKKYFNLSQPEWVDKSFLEVERAINNSLNYIYGGSSDVIGLPQDKELLKYESGELIERIINHFKRKSEGERCEKLVIFASHDDATLYKLSNLLGSKDNILNSKGLIDYSASIIFELWRNKHMHYFIKILSADNAFSPFRVVTQFVNGCDEEICSFDNFEKANQMYFQNSCNRNCKS
uniref:Histidine acid phosphatase family protein n=1 Tax=Rhabditophanes sp. KR3021 TaxID=114890 RepID=A0AC35UBV6_9BILA